MIWPANLDRSHATEIASIGAVVIFAFAIRMFNLGKWSFWSEEVNTVIHVKNLIDGPLGDWKISSALIYASLNLFGISEWSARLAPALIGALSIPILYLPTKRIIGQRAAVICSLLLSVSLWHLFWSQNARFYSLLLLFYTLGLLFFYLGFEENKPLYLVGALLMFGLAIQERPTALFFAPITLLYLVTTWLLPFDKPPGLRLQNIVLFYGVGVVAATLIVYQFPAVREPALWQLYFGTANTNPFNIFAGAVYWLGVPVLVLGTVGAAYLVKERNRAGILFGFGAIVPLVGIMVASAFQFAANRYVFVSLTSWTILAGLAITILLSRTQRHVILLTSGVLFVVVFHSLSQIFLYNFAQNGNRENWKAAFSRIQEGIQPGDMVVSANTRIGDYYLGRETRGFGGFNPSDGQNPTVRTWIVENRYIPNNESATRSWYLENAILIDVFDVHIPATNYLMRVYLYDPAGNK